VEKERHTRERAGAMGCRASAAATGSVPADGAVTVDRASLPPQLPRGCGISDWQQRQPTCVVLILILIPKSNMDPSNMDINRPYGSMMTASPQLHA
jgi:hypothetical protein